MSKFRNVDVNEMAKIVGGSKSKNGKVHMGQVKCGYATACGTLIGGIGGGVVGAIGGFLSGYASACM